MLPSQLNKVWRGVREAEGDRLEICCGASHREFESPPLRHRKQGVSSKELAPCFVLNRFVVHSWHTFQQEIAAKDRRG